MQQLDEDFAVHSRGVLHRVVAIHAHTSSLSCFFEIIFSLRNSWSAQQEGVNSHFIFHMAPIKTASKLTLKLMLGNLPGSPADEAAAEMDRSKLHAVLKLASEASRSSNAVPLNPKMLK